MFRNQYDTDVTTWSPAGRIHQIEYAMEAVKQGSAAVGVRSNTHVVLTTLKRAASELSSYQKKIFKIDDHMGVAIAGLTADGRILSRYMRNECINHRFVYDAPLPVSRLVRQVADKSQVCTQRSYTRPYGVGMLVAGVDSTGPHLFQTCPSGNYYEFHAVAIGARSQAAKTYLERKFEGFPDMGVDELIQEGLKALSSSISDNELTASNCSVAVVGITQDLTILEGATLEPYIALLKEEGGAAEPVDEGAPTAEAALPEGGEGAPGGDVAAPMET